jgi:hypothetical protein
VHVLVTYVRVNVAYKQRWYARNALSSLACSAHESDGPEVVKFHTSCDRHSPLPAALNSKHGYWIIIIWPINGLIDGLKSSESLGVRDNIRRTNNPAAVSVLTVREVRGWNLRPRIGCHVMRAKPITVRQIRYRGLHVSHGHGIMLPTVWGKVTVETRFRMFWRKYVL